MLTYTVVGQFARDDENCNRKDLPDALTTPILQCFAEKPVERQYENDDLIGSHVSGFLVPTAFPIHNVLDLNF